MKRTIAIVTGTRAEYYLLQGLLHGIEDDAALELQLLVTGMHLSPEFGSTWRDIAADGFHIDRKIEMLLSSDSAVGVSKSIGLAVAGFADVLDELRPDMMLVLGDRFEIFAAVTAALIARIPVAHLHGGETTEGAFDESIRHCITKMSHLHFPATEEYRRRIIQLGEDPARVFNVGSLGVENIIGFEPMSRADLETSLGFVLGPRNLLVTYHPVTLENNSSEVQFSALLEVLGELDDTHIIFTSPNADPGGRVVGEMISKFVAAHSDTAMSAISLGMKRYLSAMSYVDGVVGNSSSGIIEAPSFRVGTVNIGDRQRGRTRAGSVIDCDPDSASIREAIQILYSDEFRDKLKTVDNPYRGRNTAGSILQVLREYPLESILKKTFHDLSKLEETE